MTTTSEPSPSGLPAASVTRRDVPKESLVKRIFSFLGWLLTGFGLLGHLRRTSRENSEEIVVYAVHQSFFLWALVLVGFVGAEFVRHWGHAVIWGWLYVWSLALHAGHADL